MEPEPPCSDSEDGPVCGTCRNWIADGGGCHGTCVALELQTPACTACKHHYEAKDADEV